ncbi:xanthine dehydrogenase family protein molybdopterin-binding subunit [Massilia sp. TS11]|uniref:xanthine dehydrogenase family protein molybdopterin-binding subunit n=1 Tax=Massilia sp. TS11 TaxID=2908003 RepID=UPI001EDBBF53|nr:molybdopterin cofactor-binding domain-containing protein [Massilia sp. TS11]MCG2585246.1 molybdopterin-dependent oxidoreductase [Massilia sp. TS11]
MKPAPHNPRRRALLQGGAALAAALCVPSALFAASAPALAPNVFVRITPQGVTLVVPRSEMGQGIRTALAMVMCEELDLRLAQVQVLRADGDARYGDQDTVGDDSFRQTWLPLRKAAAAARAMLVLAASRRWGLAPDSLRTEAGQVLAPDGRSLAYGALVADAAREAVPAEPVLKAAQDFRLIGRPTAGIDLDAITRGQGRYGIDQRLPGMRYAMLVRAPLPGMRLARFDAAAARRQPGVLDVFALPGQFAAEAATLDAVAVIGRDTWSCLQGRKAVRAEWAAGDSLAMDSAQLRAAMEAAADRGGTVYTSRGDVDAARAQATRTLKRRYFTPYITHATMEPPVCTATVTHDHCTVWAPTQNPGEARERIAAELGWPLSRVSVHVTMIGGGFGRKSLHDFVLESVRLSRRIGAPVKLLWTREDDLRHGFYKSPALTEIELGLDADGGLLFWRQHSVQSGGSAISNGKPVAALEVYEVGGGPTRVPYAVPHQRAEGSHVETPLRRSWVRGVQDVFHAIAPNCALDELAVASGRDPLAWRLALLEPARKIQFFRTSLPYEQWYDTGRLAAVLRKAGELAGWGRPLAAGQGRGVAAHFQSLSYVGMVAQVHVDGARRLRVERVCVAVDCGLVVNPDSARAQVEGAIAFALGAVLYGQVGVDAAGVTVSNFHDYQVARITDMPAVDVVFMPSTLAPSGLGEICVPPLAPAVMNAVAAACGQRCTELPLRLA